MIIVDYNIGVNLITNIGKNLYSENIFARYSLLKIYDYAKCWYISISAGKEKKRVRTFTYQ